ncbi:MAG: hypothetical protein MZW92_48585 [Comamonadaceae bacterium]|nr:hypothetical protein [Comamonadaceae bacterium]
MVMAAAAPDGGFDLLFERPLEKRRGDAACLGAADGPAARRCARCPTRLRRRHGVSRAACSTGSSTTGSAPAAAQQVAAAPAADARSRSPAADSACARS